MYDESNLTGAAKTGKKYNVQVDLYTEKYFETYMTKDTTILITKRLSIPKDSSKVVITNKDSILKYDIGSDWSNYNSKSTTLNVIPLTNSTFLNGNAPLIFVDGKKISHDEMRKINPSTIESINVLKDKLATEKYGEEGKNGVILIKLKPAAKPIFVIDGKKTPDIEMSNINPNDIFSMNVLKDEVATGKYGDEGKNGVIEITTKKAFRENLPYDYANFLNRNKDVRSLNWSNDNKNVTISLNDGTSETYLLWVAESKRRVIDKYGVLPTPPAPRPSEKPLVISVPHSDRFDASKVDNKVTTLVQIAAEFPGGKEGWQKFLEKKFES